MTWRGWYLQPDINVPAYLPIIAVDSKAGTVTVAGNYSSLAGSMVLPSGGGEPEFKLSRFRIFAPPGVNRHNVFGTADRPDTGWFSREVAADSSRYLYKGYRFESPLAGMKDSNNNEVVGRQQGLNFAGMYYTLHRHYDPVLMRFTSPDPLAAPFYNLYHYAGNSPTAYFDPDGLERTFRGNLSDGWGYFAKDQTRREYARDTFGIRVFDMVTFGLVVTDKDWEALAYVASTQGEQAMSGFQSGYSAGTGAGIVVQVGAAALTGGAIAGAFRAAGGAAYTGGAAFTGNSIAGGIATWAFGEMAMRSLEGRGQTLGESAVSFGIGAALPVVGALASRVGAASVGMGGNMRAAWQQVRGSMYAPQGMPKFTQSTASTTFNHGPFKGRTIGDVASGLQTGAISPKQLPLDVVVRNGSTLSLNTRSLLALRRGGISPSRFVVNNRTGDAFFEGLLTKRLAKNKLGSSGAEVLRITGLGPHASSLR
jgi:RHS repeat-associated protein